MCESGTKCSLRAPYSRGTAYWIDILPGLADVLRLSFGIDAQANGTGCGTHVKRGVRDDTCDLSLRMLPAEGVWRSRGRQDGSDRDSQSANESPACLFLRITAAARRSRRTTQTTVPDHEARWKVTTVETNPREVAAANCQPGDSVLRGYRGLYRRPRYVLMCGSVRHHQA